MQLVVESFPLTDFLYIYTQKKSSRSKYYKEFIFYPRQEICLSTILFPCCSRFPLHTQVSLSLIIPGKIKGRKLKVLHKDENLYMLKGRNGTSTSFVRHLYN